MCALAGCLQAVTGETPSPLAPLENAARLSIDRAGFLRQHEAVFLQPIREGGNAIPVGNGDLAAVAWQPGHLTWMLNKCDIGGTSQAARLTVETPYKISDRIGTLETLLSLDPGEGPRLLAQALSRENSQAVRVRIEDLMQNSRPDSNAK